jgi:hypothetical protein
VTIESKVIADSINAFGNRLTTFQLRYPRFIHAEFMTHRVFSRNARSSRAVPTKKLIEEVRNDPVIPVYWGKNQPGMQAVEELPIAERLVGIDIWLSARDTAADRAASLERLGAHKQIVNRILEPFLHIDVVVSATEYDNFFALRRHKDAQPEIRTLADAMWEAMEKSKPRLLRPEDWHIPYVDPDEEVQLYRKDPLKDLPIRVSVSRCARVSYKVFEEDRRPTLEEDLKLYDKLVGSQPMHASPAEHQATPDRRNPMSPGHGPMFDWANPREWGNFVGWRQYRKMLPGECVKKYKAA